MEASDVTAEFANLHIYKPHHSDVHVHVMYSVAVNLSTPHMLTPVSPHRAS